MTISHKCVPSAALEKVILVGHSYGGMVITGVADRLASKLDQLVYLDADVPEVGESNFDGLKAAGLDPVKTYGLVPLKPFTDPLFFSVKTLKKIPKVYILCTASEFLNVTRVMAQRVLKAPKDNHWRYVEINAHHSAMEDHPQEVAEILGGVVVL